MKRAFLTETEAAELLGVHPSTVRRWRYAREIFPDDYDSLGPGRPVAIYLRSDIDGIREAMAFDERIVRNTWSSDRAARAIGVSPVTLRRWRRRGRGPAYVLAGRSPRYRPKDVERWLTHGRYQERTRG